MKPLHGSTNFYEVYKKTLDCDRHGMRNGKSSRRTKRRNNLTSLHRNSVIRGYTLFPPLATTTFLARGLVFESDKQEKEKE